MVFRPELGPYGRRYGAAAFVLCGVAILYLSLAPGEATPVGAWPLDKVQHAFAYFVLTGLALYAFGPRPVLLAAIALMGAGLEVLQAAMGFGRQGDLRDLAANLSGEAAALGLWLWLRRRR